MSDLGRLGVQLSSPIVPGSERVPTSSPYSADVVECLRSERFKFVIGSVDNAVSEAEQHP